MMPTFARTTALVVALAASSSAIGGNAAVYLTPASAACDAALPVYDAHVRKRPRAVQNEGDVPVFVTCGQQTNGQYLPTRVTLRFDNTGATAATVDCTLAIEGAQAVYRTLTTTLPAAARDVELTYMGQGSELRAVTHALSCRLAPGVAVTAIEM